MNPRLLHSFIRTGAAILTLAALTGPVASAQEFPEAQHGPSTIQWQEDLDSLVTALERLHPDPFARVDREEWLAQAEALKTRFEEMDDSQVVASLMGLVSGLKDGHTSLYPVGPNGFSGWFPFRMMAFDERLFLTVLPPEHEDLLGGEVFRIGSLSAEDAFARIATVIPADNPVGKLTDTPMFLPVAELLHAFGVISDANILPLTVRKRDGSLVTVNLSRVGGDFGYDRWYWWPSLGPGDGQYTSYFEEQPGPLPLHLRHRISDQKNFWYQYLPDSGVMYLQSNAILDSPSESIEDFFEGFFQAADSLKDEINGLVVDLRYNSGGNGYQLPPVVEALKARPWLTGPGRVAVLTGQKTFSAAVVTTAMLKNELGAILVGSPGAAGFNFFSDMRSYVLPNSGLALWAATMHWEYGTPGDLSGSFEVDVPVPFGPEAYLSGEDPVLLKALEVLGADVDRRSGSGS